MNQQISEFHPKFSTHTQALGVTTFIYISPLTNTFRSWSPDSHLSFAYHRCNSWLLCSEMVCHPWLGHPTNSLASKLKSLSPPVTMIWKSIEMWKMAWFGVILGGLG